MAYFAQQIELSETICHVYPFFFFEPAANMNVLLENEEANEVEVVHGDCRFY
jgi:hypothetical protein